MPEISLFGTVSEGNPDFSRWMGDLRERMRRLCKNLPNHRDEAVLVITESTSTPASNLLTHQPFIRIESSVDMSDDDLVAIADHFNSVIDVSIRFSWGPMVFRDKGKGFGDEAIMDAKSFICSKLHEIGCCQGH